MENWAVYADIPYKFGSLAPNEHKILAKFIFGGGVVCRVLYHHKHCVRMYQGALLSSHLKYLNKATSLQVRKKYNWQCAGAEITICTGCVVEHQVGSRMLLHALHHYHCGQK